MKYLIINADDFGYSKIFNKAILALANQGLISSTTVMVDWIDEDQSEQIIQLLALSASHRLSLGLHLEFFNSNFPFEIKRQFEKFRLIFGHSPSHIDLHKSTFLKEAHQAIIEFCKTFKLPCRNMGLTSPGIIKTQNIVLNGTDLTLPELREKINKLKDGESYEILFHPGSFDPDSGSSLNRLRKNDVKKIKMIHLLLKANNIKLINYQELALLQ